MEFDALSMVVVGGASASSDSVRRALWLPRTPDAQAPLLDVVRASARPGQIAITQQDGYVLVHGLSALTFQRDWLALSADRCRVFAFLLLEGRAGNSWALYEDGRRRRAFDERNGRDEGERLPYEPAADDGEPPSARIRALYTALTEAEVGEDLDLSREVGVWFMGGTNAPRTPEPPGGGNGVKKA
jgi:hypothetical protein